MTHSCFHHGVFLGITLKGIRDQTNVKIDIPRREDTLNVPNGQANGHASGKATPIDDEDEEPTIPITVQGPETAVYEAKALLNHKTCRPNSSNKCSKSTCNKLP